jgi:anti-sigma-K factor RskA
MIDPRTEAQASRYVLGALPPHEARQFEAAMLANPKLRLLVRELRGTAGVAGTPITATTGSLSATPTSTTHSDQPSTPAGAVSSKDDQSGSWTGWMPWALAACFAILCVAMISIGRSLREQAVTLTRQLEEKDQHGADLQLQLDQLQAQIDRQGTNYQTRLVEVQKEFLQRIAEINRQTVTLTNQLRQQLGDAQRRMTELSKRARDLEDQRKALEDALIATAASDRLASSRLSVLRPTADGPPGVIGASIWSPQDQRGLLVLEGIAPPPANQVYQMWIYDPAFPNPVSGGALQVGPGGSVRLQFAVPVRVESAQRFAISVESVGGVAAPTGKIILSGN